MTETLRTNLYRLIEGRHGRFLTNPADIYIGRSLIEYGEFSELEWQLLARLLRPGAVVIEAGANMGALTVPIAKAVGIGGLVHAFEPQALVFQLLCANLALNDLINVHAVNAGCAAEIGTMRIARLNPERAFNFGGVSLDRLASDDGLRIPVERLDDVVDPRRLDLIKADVEGMELDVLRGAEGLIGRFRPFLYLETSEAAAPALFAYLEALNYAAYWHQPPLFNPKNHLGNEQNHFANIVSRNVLAAPRERDVKVVGLRAVAGPDDFPTKWSTG